ncbi:DUF3310 domain-containing protein [Psychrobacter pygoscelis]|uniref:DUF3310 domain-containing protein n=1 Tax=Psychrobacter pygoscelis TaxID=2488563 RepID=UPI001F61A3AF|nr:DUF3310 domain-containing protein [Psychrobacter pygoscelis]
MSNIEVGSEWVRVTDGQETVVTHVEKFNNGLVDISFVEDGRESGDEQEFFLERYKPKNNIELGDIWVTKDQGIECEITKIAKDGDLSWITSYSAIDDFTDTCPLSEFLDEYEFVRKGVNKASAVNLVDDAVNHPPHYTSDPSGIECIQITRHRNFNIGNAIKYLWRNGLKDGNDSTQDLKKAVWYIQDEIARLEALNDV